MNPHCVRTALASVVCIFLGASFASAQATRTWVSGVGDDANPCSRTAPCKTFGGTISKTAAGGEISMTDAGNFGTITINKSITVSGWAAGGGITGANTNGVTINAGPNDVVTLRHLQINGMGTGQIGIRVLAGSLVVDDVAVSGFETGIDIADGNTVVMHSMISNNRTVGVSGRGGTVTVESSTITNNGIAVVATAPGVVRLSDNGIYNNLTGFACGSGTLASAGDNRKAGNTGGAVATCAPTMGISVQ